MKSKHRKPEQILRHLRDVDTLMAGGKTTEAACRSLGIATPTYYSWKKKYGQMSSDELVRLKNLELENQRLKKIMANKDLQIDVLKEAAEGNWLARSDGDIS